MIKKSKIKYRTILKNQCLGDFGECEEEEEKSNEEE